MLPLMLMLMFLVVNVVLLVVKVVEFVNGVAVASFGSLLCFIHSATC
jgi:hypothetical protein